MIFVNGQSSSMGRQLRLQLDAGDDGGESATRTPTSADDRMEQVEEGSASTPTLRALSLTVMSSIKALHRRRV